MTTYRGSRDSNGFNAVVTVDGEPLNPRLDLANHSPDGFNWDYGGSGPAQLALAILADVTGDDQLALRHYQSFRETCISRLHSDQWNLSSDVIKEWIDLEIVYRLHEAEVLGDGKVTKIPSFKVPYSGNA